MKWSKGRRKLAWFGGAILGAILFLPPVVKTFNTLTLALGGNSSITFDGKATINILIEVWLLFGFVYLIYLQSLGGLAHSLFPFVLSWSSTILFFSLLPYIIALPIWLLFSFAIWLY